MKTIITIGNIQGTKQTNQSQNTNSSYNTSCQSVHKELKLLDGSSNKISYK